MNKAENNLNFRPYIWQDFLFTKRLTQAHKHKDGRINWYKQKAGCYKRTMINKDEDDSQMVKSDIKRLWKKKASASVDQLTRIRPDESEGEGVG